MLIGVAQIVAGAALIAFGCPTLGKGFISEGFSDIIYGATALATGEFSWTDYAISKAISLFFTIISMGMASGEATKGA